MGHRTNQPKEERVEPATADHNRPTQENGERPTQHNRTRRTNSAARPLTNSRAGRFPRLRMGFVAGLHLLVRRSVPLRKAVLFDENRLGAEDERLLVHGAERGNVHLVCITNGTRRLERRWTRKQRGAMALIAWGNPRLTELSDEVARNG